MALPRPTTLDFIRGRQDWRARLERDYQAVSTRLQSAYRRTLAPLQAQLDTLTAEIGAAEGLTAEEVRGLRTYRDLLRRIETEMQGFAAITRNEMGDLQGGAVQLGLDSAFDLASGQLNAGQARVIAGAWLRPDPAALQALIDYADGAALRDRMATFGANAAQNFADTMLSLVAQGRNPRAIGRTMATWFNLPYAWADNQARTLQLYSYRAANHATYRANERILDGWLWRAALDARTCMSCVSQHGSIHPVSNTLNDHHRGRCAPIPIVKGTTWAASVESGEAWFARQSPAMQRQMMGPGLFAAYQRGQVNFSDLSQPYQDGVYGTMLRQASLRDLGLRGTRSDSTTGGSGGSAAGGTGGPPSSSALVSAHLTLPTHALRAALDEALALIDTLHTDGPLPSIHVLFDSSLPPGELGAYRVTPPHEIAINPAGSTRHSTFAHEIGHFLDQLGLSPNQPKVRVFSSDAAAAGLSSALTGWWGAVQVSPQYQALAGARASGARSITVQGFSVPINDAALQYFLQPPELFARAYQQWVALRANDATMTAEFQARRSGLPYGRMMYWSDRDFAPIAAEIDAAFRQEGWMP